MSPIKVMFKVNKVIGVSKEGLIHISRFTHNTVADKYSNQITLSLEKIRIFFLLG
jgi:hypothetical protein